MTRVSDERAIEVLTGIVSTPSVSGAEQPAAVRFVAEASALGLCALIDDAGNAIAHRGDDGAPVHLVLLGHIDTVQGHIPVRLEDGVLHGRGSVDAKGPLVAMLIAAAQADLPEGCRLTVAGAVGEETPTSPGANAIAPRFSPSACIIGEPSGWDGVTLGYKGRLLIDAHTSTDNAHSAGAADSAADILHAAWHRVRTHIDAHNEGIGGAFDAIQGTLLNVQTSNDGLTQTAALRAGFRLPPGVEPSTLAETIAELMGEGVRITTEGHEIAHVTDRNDAVVRALSGAIRSEGGRPRPKKKTGTADLNVVGPVWNCPIAAYGPGDSALDHTPEEHLHIDEFLRSIRVLTRAIETLAGELVAHDHATPIVETVAESLAVQAGSGERTGSAS